MTEAIKTYLEADTEKIEQIIEKYPRQIPTKIVAELMGVSPENIRQAVSEGELGISWRKPGKLTGGNCMICLLIDSERQRQQDKKDERRDKRIIFEHQMERIREEREEQGCYHWGEVRVRVRRGRRAA